MGAVGVLGVGGLLGYWEGGLWIGGAVDGGLLPGPAKLTKS